MENLSTLIHLDYTLMVVGIGAALLGTVSGALGTYAVLRRQSLLGDAISHAALPGIAIAFLLTGSKTPLILVFGAAVAGWLGTLLIMGIVRLTRIKYDSVLAIVLSTFFGFGLVLHTLIQRTGNANQAGLDTFLFRTSRDNFGERYPHHRYTRWHRSYHYVGILERVEIACF